MLDRDDNNFIRYHGNWGGPNWTAGQAKPTADLTDADRSVPAIDEFDQACKDHDIGLHDATTPEEVQQVNARFIEQARQYGYKGTAAAILVALAGPSQPNPTESANMPSKRRADTGRSPKGRKYLRLEGSDEASYSDEYDREAIARHGAEDIGDIVAAGFELDRQEEEDQALRNVLLTNDRNDGSPTMRRIDFGRQLPISPDNRPFDNSRPVNQADPRAISDFNNNTHRGGNPFERPRARQPMSDSSDVNMERAGATVANAVAVSNGGPSAGQNITTPIERNIRTSFPWHHVENAIHQHHACFSVNHLVSTSEVKNYVKGGGR